MMSIFLECIKVASTTFTNINIDYVDFVTKGIVALVYNFSLQIPKAKRKKTKAVTTTQIILDLCFSDYSDFATSCIIAYYIVKIKS